MSCLVEDSASSDLDYMDFDPSELTSDEDDDLCGATSDTAVESSPLSEDELREKTPTQGPTPRKKTQLSASSGYAPAKLYAGNVHPPSYYQQKIKDCDEARFKRKQYARKTRRALDRILRVWKLYVRVHNNLLGVQCSSQFIGTAAICRSHGGRQ